MSIRSKSKMEHEKFWLHYLRGKYSYNKETGELTNRFGRVVGIKTPPGYLRINCRINIKRYDFYVHRVAFLIVEGRWPVAIDHINGKKADNRWVNLREADQTQNMRNVPLFRKNKSGVPGVGKSGRKFRASIGDGIGKEIGSFDDFFEAVCARKSAEIRLGYHPNHGRPAEHDENEKAAA